MVKHSEIIARRREARTERERTPWGWRHRLAAADGWEVFHETILAGARKDTAVAREGQLTILVVAGVVWIRDCESRAITRLAPGGAFTSTPGRAFDVATGSLDADVLVVQPPGFDTLLERVPGTGIAIDPGQGRRALPAQAAGPRRPQPSFEDRAAIANAAQGLGRVQPLPGQARTSAEVAYGFNQLGVNLAPVVPEP